MLEAVYFTSSLLIVLTGIVRYNRNTISSSIYVIIISICYSIFCFIAFGKIQGFIPSDNISSLISQHGYDPSRLPLSISKLTRFGLIGGIIFNIFTVFWLILKGGFWNYCLISAILFCTVGLAIGPFIGLNPIYSLFGLCCGFMAAVAWVFGLTYVEFCVIGNIYIPSIAIILAAANLIRSLVMKHFLLKWLIIIVGACQIIGVFVLLHHYYGGFNYAFYQCVKDLNALAKNYDTTYEAVNIFIYIVIIPLFFAIDIILWRLLKTPKNEC